MAATALFRLTRDSEAWPELSVLAAGGFRDTTRLAGTDASMAHDIALTNRDQVIHWLERYREALGTLQRQIADTEDEAAFFRLLAQTNVEYEAFRSGVIGRREVDEKHYQDIPDVSMVDLLMGSTMAERTRELTRRSEERLAESERRARMGDRG
jgi:hypothetical protein